MTMIKRALAIALLGLGMSFAGHVPASAAMPMAGVAVPLSTTAGDALTPVGYSACWWDVPVIGAGVAFFELLRDTEYDYHCSRHFEGERNYREGERDYQERDRYDRETHPHRSRHYK
jgi:hypothetical protein